jgi:hypothetical protein
MDTATARGRGGVQALATRLYAEHRSYLLNIATRNAPSRDDAEDTLQDAFPAFRRAGRRRLRLPRGPHRAHGPFADTVWMVRSCFGIRANAVSSAIRPSAPAENAVAACTASYDPSAYLCMRSGTASAT